jgi:aspartyl-tRNA(Asn)/glutamyl-tRNA(Gln) amidotransferase subunit A
MHELAMGGTTTNPHYGATHNPWKLDRIPGGSSGGSAAAVAAGFCYAAMGTDTGGSVRAPAAYCGLAGLKGTYGRVSIYGVVPLSWTLDHAGPLARTTEDVALVMNAIAGHDPQDDGSANQPVPDFTARLDDGLQGLRLGVPRSHFFEQIHSEVRTAVEAALGVLRDLGATVEDVDFPDARQALDLYSFINRPEAASFQEEFLRTRPDDYGSDVRVNPEMGAVILATDYLRAQRLRTAMRRAVEQLFARVDALVTPTVRITAHPIGQPVREIEGQPLGAVGPNIGLTVQFDLTGSPALSVCCGFAADGLPMGLQIVGRAWDEPTTLHIGAAYERATPWSQRHPSL